MLLRLEHESAAIKLQSRKQNVQADILEKRDVIKRLNERLRELDQVCYDGSSAFRWYSAKNLNQQLDDGADLDEDEDGEDLLGEDDEDAQEQNLEPSLGRKVDQLGPATPLHRRKASSLEGQPEASISGSFADTTSNLRARHGSSAAEHDTATTTSSQQHPDLSTTEKLFSHNRSEQEDLTSSLLNMAQALKESSKAFSSTLDSEKSILDRTGEGLEKNTSGMQAAEQRMGTLRRMTEGRGWWGRMLMYAWIAGLMIIALVIVGFLPKLRF